MYLPTIDTIKTGENIKRLMKEKNVSMYKLQMDLGLQSATNIYAWLRGKHLPSVDESTRDRYTFPPIQSAFP